METIPKEAAICMGSVDETDGETFDISQVAAALRADANVRRRLETPALLAAWVGRGKSVTSTGVPKPADAAAAARACGLAVPPGKVARAARIPGLVEAWDLALAAGLVELEGGRALPGPNHGAWPDGPDEEVVEVWLFAFTESVGLAVNDEDGMPIIDDDGLICLAACSLLGAGPRSLADLATELNEASQRDIGPLIAMMRASVHGDPARLACDRLVGWGLAAHDGDLVSLTLPGAFAVHELGLMPVRQIDPSLDATALLAALAAEPELGPEAARSWLDARPAPAAAGQLLAAAADTDPLSRIMAVGLVQELGPEALPAWRKAARLPGSGAHARLFLHEFGNGAEPTSGDTGWVAADIGAAMAAMADRGVPPEQMDAMIGDAFADPEEDERAGLASAIRASGHPGAKVALELLDPAVSIQF